MYRLITRRESATLRAVKHSWRGWLSRLRTYSETRFTEIDAHFDAIKKDLEGQKTLKLTDPSTWFGGGEVTPQAGEELKGLEKRRADAKAKAKQILQGGLDIKAGEERMAAERAQRMAMQEKLVAGTVGRVEEMGLIGQVEQGNIDLSNRPQVKNPDGSVSTVRSISIEQDGQRILIPTVVNGKVVSDQEAVKNFQKSGEHLGVFADQKSANQFAQKLHEEEAGRISKAGAQNQLGNFSPRGENLLPPKPSAVVEIPEALQGVPIPGNPDLKQWTEEDKAKWGAMSPDQKKAWVANRPQVGQIAQAEAQKAARSQAWWQNSLKSVGRGAALTVIGQPP